MVIDKNNSDEFYAARKGSPLVIGIGNNEYFVASDASPIIEYTDKVIYLEDGEVARLNKNQVVEIKTIDDKAKNPYVQKLEQSLESIEKGGYDHFMLKEIYDAIPRFDNNGFNKATTISFWIIMLLVFYLSLIHI